jgi:chaperone modulatory protein CbpM
MTSDSKGALSGEIFDEYVVLSVDELSRLCAVDTNCIIEMVEEGVLTVVEVTSSQWRFSGSSLRRARTALRLQRDLEINLPGVALALDLMDELDMLRRELQVQRR